jgi:glycerol-3-phosphate dehydrogenase
LGRQETDVLVIGGGVIGLSVARELSKYDLRCTVVEKESDVGLGISKTSAGFINMGLLQAVALIVKDIAGGDPHAEIGSEMFNMLWEGFSGFDRLAHALDIPHRHLGAIVCARNDAELEKLHRLRELAEYVPGGEVRWLERGELFEMEPCLTPDAVAGLYDPAGTIHVFPLKYIHAIYENILERGVCVHLDAECTGISSDGEFHRVRTSRGTLFARYVVNCAGRYADRVADMVEGRSDWGLLFSPGQALIFDRRAGTRVNNLVTNAPEALKVDVVSPLLYGNLLVYGGDYTFVENREALATTRANFRETITRMKTLVPGLDERDILTSYVGMRVFNSRNPDHHLISYADGNRRFINVVVKQPGFTPAPRIAEKVAGMLAESGLSLRQKDAAVDERADIPLMRELDADAQAAWIRSNPQYGRVVCRCESVTEGEIVESIRRGANTVQGVMFRTRAGMGRCQQDYCGPRIVDLLARELGRDVAAITHKGGGSEIIKSC